MPRTLSFASIVGRIMTSYFDPKYWSPFRAAEVGKSWMDQWIAVTSSWVDPVATLGAGTVTALLPDVLMSALTDGIASRFGGKQIDLTVNGTQIQGVLHGLRVRRRGSVFEAEIELTDVDWNGHSFEQLNAVANGVRLVPGVPTRLDAQQIDLEGRVSMGSLVDWLNDRGLDWKLRAEQSGLIHARNPAKRLSALVDASITDDLVRINVVRARWMGVPVPQGLLSSRTFQLPPLPNDARIVRAVRERTSVRFSLDVPTVSGSLDLAQIRNAIVAGTGLIVW